MQGAPGVQTPGGAASLQAQVLHMHVQAARSL